MNMKKVIALLGEYMPTFPPHTATSAALEHSRALLDSEIEGVWVSTALIDQSLFDHYSGLWVAPGSPYKSLDKTLWAIRHAREHAIPCFGTCGGFQHMIIEYARHVLGFHDAHHAEYDPYASRLFISQLECSLASREMRLQFMEGSQVAAIYGAQTAVEEYYCNFGVNPACVPLLRSGPLQVTGADSEGEARVIELPGHPFFIGTLFVPQMRSTPQNPHPLVTAFLQAVLTSGEHDDRLSRSLYGSVP
jgi:CTP synthase (UTP-ammonia lyase)